MSPQEKVNVKEYIDIDIDCIDIDIYYIDIHMHKEIP